MTSRVVTVGPDATVSDIAKVLLERRSSALPVVDDGGRPVGVVSEGDLMARAGEAQESARSWWLRLLSDLATEARDYVKQHGRFAHEVMTRQVVTVPEDAPVQAIARMGTVESHDEFDALRVIQENVPGLERVESHVTVFNPAALASRGGDV